MIEIKMLQQGKVGVAQLDDALFAGRHNPVVLREAVLMYEANRRVGTASTLTRSEVKGTTHKMFRQKGTGRGRRGDRKAPGLRGGGVAHGPKPRDFSYALPRKALRRALVVAMAGKLRDGEVMRWTGETLTEGKPSTKSVRASLATLGAGDNALIVAPGAVDQDLVLSVRNLPRVRVLPADDVTAYDVVAHRWVVFLDNAYEMLSARLDTGRLGTGAQGVDEEGSAS
jgi:large subunit ribosomal protein L4